MKLEDWLFVATNKLPSNDTANEIIAWVCIAALVWLVVSCVS